MHMCVCMRIYTKAYIYMLLYISWHLVVGVHFITNPAPSMKFNEINFEFGTHRLFMELHVPFTVCTCTDCLLYCFCLLSTDYTEKYSIMTQFC